MLKRAFFIQAAVLGFLVSGFLLTSCGPRSAEAIAEKMIERAAAKGGEEVDIDLSGEQVSVKDKEGNTFTMGTAELPEGWPAAAPFDRNLEIVFSGASKSEGKNAWTVNASSEKSAEDIYGYYKKELSGWEINSDTVMDMSGQKSYSLEADNGTYQMSLFISGEDEGVAVMVGLVEM